MRSYQQRPQSVLPSRNSIAKSNHFSNRVLPFIQPKLKIGAVNDRYEQEADRVASQVMSTSTPQHATQPAAFAIQRKPDSGTVAQQNAAASIQGMPAGGQSLDAASQSYFNTRFGRDFSRVRIHADDRAHQMAQSVNANAFTLGQHIVFNRGQYQPASYAGRKLLAHELTHVVQQSQGVTNTLQRDEQPIPDPEFIEDSAGEENRWRRRVNHLIRSFYGLRGPGISSSRISFIPQEQLDQQLPRSTIQNMLIDIFMEASRGSMEYQILEYNNLADSRETEMGHARLLAFIEEGMRQDAFTGRTGVGHNPRSEYQLATGQPGPPHQTYTVSPRELVAGRVGGLTDTSQDGRGQRSILVSSASYVEVLVHEAVHFYVSNEFRDQVDAHPQSQTYLYGARIGQALTEGLTEYFSRELVRAHPQLLGAYIGMAYRREVAVAERLVATMGEQGARQAFFNGDQHQLRRLFEAVQQYRQTHRDLLVPDFMISP